MDRAAMWSSQRSMGLKTQRQTQHRPFAVALTVAATAYSAASILRNILPEEAHHWERTKAAQKAALIEAFKSLYSLSFQQTIRGLAEFIIFNKKPLRLANREGTSSCSKSPSFVLSIGDKCTMYQCIIVLLDKIHLSNRRCG